MASLKVVVTDHVFESFAAEEQILGNVGAELQVLQCR